MTVLAERLALATRYEVELHQDQERKGSGIPSKTGLAYAGALFWMQGGAG